VVRLHRCRGLACLAGGAKTKRFPLHHTNRNTTRGKNQSANKIAKGIQRIKIDPSEVKRREEPPFPANPWYKVSNFHHKILTLGEKREEERKRNRMPGRGGARLFLRQGKEKNRERKGEGVRGHLTPIIINLKILNYP